MPIYRSFIIYDLLLVCPCNYRLALDLHHFCRAMLCKRGLCHHAVSVCVSVCPSVCLSRSYILSKWIKINLRNFLPSGSHTILVFPHRTGWRYSDVNPLNGGVECRWSSHKSQNLKLLASTVAEIRRGSQTFWMLPLPSPLPILVLNVVFGKQHPVHKWCKNCVAHMHVWRRQQCVSSEKAIFV